MAISETIVLQASVGYLGFKVHVFPGLDKTNNHRSDWNCKSRLLYFSDLLIDLSYIKKQKTKFSAIIQLREKCLCIMICSTRKFFKSVNDQANFSFPAMKFLRIF